MAEQTGTFPRGFGGERRARRARRPRAEDKAQWVPVTKLGRLVNAGKIGTLEEIYLHSLPIREFQIIDNFFEKKPMGVDAPAPTEGGKILMDKVMKIKPVQKQTTAGQRTRFKAFVLVGDGNGHVGVGVKCAKEVATAIRGGIVSAKLALLPIRRGYWGNLIGNPHTVPMKVHGKCGSVRVRLVPAPRGTGVVGAPTTKSVLAFAGVADCFSCTSGHSRTRGNFMFALYDALSKTYGYLTPDLWKKTKHVEHLLEQHSHFLHENQKVSVQ